MAPLEGAKQDTIGVTWGTNAKMLYHKGFVLIYLVKNEMPFAHHIIKR